MNLSGPSKNLSPLIPMFGKKIGPLPATKRETDLFARLKQQGQPGGNNVAQTPSPIGPGQGVWRVLDKLPPNAGSVDDSFGSDSSMLDEESFDNGSPLPLSPEDNPTIREVENLRRQLETTRTENEAQKEELIFASQDFLEVDAKLKEAESKIVEPPSLYSFSGMNLFRRQVFVPTLSTLSGLSLFFSYSNPETAINFFGWHNFEALLGFVGDVGFEGDFHDPAHYIINLAFWGSLSVLGGHLGAIAITAFVVLTKLAYEHAVDFIKQKTD